MIEFEIKELFFDREKVVHAVDKAKRAALSKAGAFIRQRAKTSIRKRKGIAPPGQPPFSHEGTLRRLIYFGYDKESGSVVIGPAPFKEGVAPHALEFGGQQTIREKRRGRVVTRKAAYRPRPFMGPALEAERAHLPDPWAGSVKGG